MSEMGSCSIVQMGHISWYYDVRVTLGTNRISLQISTG